MQPLKQCAVPIPHRLRSDSINSCWKTILSKTGETFIAHNDFDINSPSESQLIQPWLPAHFCVALDVYVSVCVCVCCTLHGEKQDCWSWCRMPSMSIKGLFRVLLGTAPDCLCPWDAIYCERLSARAPVCVCPWDGKARGQQETL